MTLENNVIEKPNSPDELRYTIIPQMIDQMTDAQLDLAIVLLSQWMIEEGWL